MPESFDRGAMTETVFYLLLAFHEKMHGYGAIKKVSEMTDGRIEIPTATLYGAINVMLIKGWISEVESDDYNSRKREYIVTAKGKKAFTAELERLEELIANGRKYTKK